MDRAVRNILTSPPAVAGSPYAGRETGRRIAETLATVDLGGGLLRKTITY